MLPVSLISLSHSLSVAAAYQPLSLITLPLSLSLTAIGYQVPLSLTAIRYQVSLSLTAILYIIQYQLISLSVSLSALPAFFTLTLSSSSLLSLSLSPLSACLSAYQPFSLSASHSYLTPSSTIYRQYLPLSPTIGYQLLQYQPNFTLSSAICHFLQLTTAVFTSYCCCYYCCSLPILLSVQSSQSLI